jgi:hypothetical protein
MKELVRMEMIFMALKTVFQAPWRSSNRFCVLG